MFGYINRTRDNQWKECSLEKFNELIDSTQVREIIADVRSGKVERKRELPAFIFSGVLDGELYKKYVAECEQRGEKPRGSRCEEFLKPTGLFMMDFDRTEGDAKQLFDKFLATMQQHQIDVKDILAAGHRTAKWHGLRLVLKGRAGSTIEADQKWISELMGEDIDEVCKDFSRISYCPCREDIFFINPDLLFGAPLNGIYEKCKNAKMQECKANEELKMKNEESSSTAQPHSSLFTLHSSLKDLDPSLVVKALEEQLGGAPKHGSRNNFIFAMACHLVHLYGNSPATIGYLVPTYGERQERWRSTIESACRTAKADHMPDVLQRALQVAELRSKGRKESERKMSNLPPALPAVLPPLIAHLTSKVPDLYKPAVAVSVFPALGTHLSGVKFRYIDNVEHEPTFMCVLMAKMSSGKSCVNKPIEYILADIEERDEENRQREQAWKEKLNTKGANKEKPKRPDDLCIQVLVSDMTNAAFVQRLADAKGKFLYTQMDEIELLDQLKTSARGQQVSQIIRLAFDCGKYGQERVGSQSVTAKVRVRWNWNASTTIQKGQDYFRKALADGTLSRLNFCTIVAQRGASVPLIGTYDHTFAEVLRPYIDHLNEAHGEIHCPEAIALVQQLLQEADRVSWLCDDESYEILSYRAVVLAYLKAMTLFVAHGCEWSREIEDFARWSLQYDMWCKMSFFGEQMRTDLGRESRGQRRGPQNLLDLLPQRFTVEDAVSVRLSQGKEGHAGQMISNWLFRKFIKFDKDTGYYEKL